MDLTFVHDGEGVGGEGQPELHGRVLRGLEVQNGLGLEVDVLEAGGICKGISFIDFDREGGVVENLGLVEVEVDGLAVLEELSFNGFTCTGDGHLAERKVCIYRVAGSGGIVGNGRGILAAIRSGILFRLTGKKCGCSQENHRKNLKILFHSNIVKKIFRKLAFIIIGEVEYLPQYVTITAYFPFKREANYGILPQICKHGAIFR